MKRILKGAHNRGSLSLIQEEFIMKAELHQHKTVKEDYIRSAVK